MLHSQDMLCTSVRLSGLVVAPALASEHQSSVRKSYCFPSEYRHSSFELTELTTPLSPRGPSIDRPGIDVFVAVSFSPSIVRCRFSFHVVPVHALLFELLVPIEIGLVVLRIEVLCL